MNIDIIISADDIKEKKILNKSVVVIDILRATSVIVTAINNGCKEVIPVLTVDEAVGIARKDRKKYMLGGERDAIKIKGFDFSNSPLEYNSDKVKDKTLIMTTTNGTRAIKASINAKHIIIAAMINAEAVAKKLINLNNDIVIVNSGTNGEFSIDDFICSGYIISILKKREFHLSDIATTALYIYENNKDIKSFIRYANHYKKISKLGLYEDLEYCCQKDIIDSVPEYKDGSIH
ncbi:2-phosphosulfolactate phosphatase family protein [Clostridium sp.]|jgi:2-phosphosulfolactate phosphatase|uniref:2-phosphosulfolactate phosphatase family protein n=1 Tax=Clostridium sp. TaxID=1506 RepID=UPI00258671E7|nr:2-phosphosulfolactate phosphatase family protein [Clostridium sp.]MDF2502936.1 phosphosulfolactate phosphohydrolase-like enzyme [Clostridium sp.]